MGVLVPSVCVHLCVSSSAAGVRLRLARAWQALVCMCSNRRAHSSASCRVGQVHSCPVWRVQNACVLVKFDGAHTRVSSYCKWECSRVDLRRARDACTQQVNGEGAYLCAHLLVSSVCCWGFLLVISAAACCMGKDGCFFSCMVCFPARLEFCCLLQAGVEHVQKEGVPAVLAEPASVLLFVSLSNLYC